MTHRAVVFDRYGDPSVLQVTELPEPHAGPGQVRVQVRAAGVQPFDCALRRGDLVGFMPARFPQQLGNDFAGVVDEVGSGVEHLAVGDDVLGFATLTAHAELVVVDSTWAVHRPTTMAWAVAGALSASGQTALNALRDLQVSAGETLLVHGATGGVGSIAVQVATALGARVVGTANPTNHNFLASLGVLPVSYGPGLANRVREVAPGGIDVVLDCAGEGAVEHSLELGVPKSRIGTIADPSAVARFGVRRPGGARSAQNLQELLELHATGRLRLPDPRTFSLAEAAAAHAAVETRHVRGKVALLADPTHPDHQRRTK